MHLSCCNKFRRPPYLCLLWPVIQHLDTLVESLNQELSKEAVVSPKAPLWGNKKIDLIKIYAYLSLSLVILQLTALFVYTPDFVFTPCLCHPTSHEAQ
jgi:hypothetical protein